MTRMDKQIAAAYLFTSLVVLLFFLVAAGLQRQLDVTNDHLAHIQRQECLDANLALRSYIAQVQPDPAPVPRECG